MCVVPAERNPATTAGETATPRIGRWGSWGAQGVFQIFDEGREEYEPDRQHLRSLLSISEYDAAREWVWEEPERATRLIDEYNPRFNSIVLRDYSTEGDRLTLPGMPKDFAPRLHQRSAVARMLSEPAVGLFHQVGAGKTAEMVIGAMELRRLGMVLAFKPPLRFCDCHALASSHPDQVRFKLGHHSQDVDNAKRWLTNGPAKTQLGRGSTESAGAWRPCLAIPLRRGAYPAGSR
ncbi:hypothetical protein FBY31_4371 [Arthrobacter sp. SLBN-100]|nr:hypothetical protein FBY31_4371 [Arthrobacter sp. SLBN-100]